jgi:hypothetical protein
MASALAADEAVGFSSLLDLVGGPAVAAALVLAAALVYCALEQLQFRWTCKQLAAPAGWFVPVVGGIVDMVRDPYGFWERQRLLQPAGISKFFLLGKTVFFSTDTEVSRRILMHNGPDSLMMVRLAATFPAGRPRIALEWRGGGRAIGAPRGGRARRRARALDAHALRAPSCSCGAARARRARAAARAAPSLAFSFSPPPPV